MTRSNAHPQIDGLIYSKVAELLLVGLLLVFIYPFVFVISGVDPTIPIKEQSENKIVFFLQVGFPFFCIAIGLMRRGSDACVPVGTMIYPIICLVSTAWSVDPYVTFKFTCIMFLYILAVAAICQVLDIDVFCKIIVRLLVFLILASVVMAVAFPKYGVHQATDQLADVHVGQWRGVFVHKNQLGAAASTSVFIFLFFGRFISSSAGFRMVCIAAATACLVFAQSAGSWVALCMLLFFYWLIRAVPVSRNTLMLIVFGVSALAFAALFFFSEDLAALVGRDATFSGRTDIWRLVLNAVWQKPFLGFGYSAATTTFMGPLLVAEIGSAAVDAHNGYLDVLLGTGMVGLIALALCIASVIVTGIDRVKTAGPERDSFMVLVTFPIMSLLNSFFEMEGIRGVETFLGALTFLSLTAVPLYLRLDRGNFRSPTSAAHTLQSIS